MCEDMTAIRATMRGIYTEFKSDPSLVKMLGGVLIGTAGVVAATHPLLEVLNPVVRPTAQQLLVDVPQLFLDAAAIIGGIKLLKRANEELRQQVLSKPAVRA